MQVIGASLWVMLQEVLRQSTGETVDQRSIGSGTTGKIARREIWAMLVYTVSQSRYKIKYGRERTISETTALDKQTLTLPFLSTPFPSPGCASSRVEGKTAEGIPPTGCNPVTFPLQRQQTLPESVLGELWGVISSR